LLQEFPEEGICIEIGRSEIGELVVAEVLVCRVRPVVLGIHDRHAVDSGHRAGAEQAGQQIERPVGSVDASDPRAGEAPQQQLAHRHDRLAAIAGIGVPSPAEVDPQFRPIPFGRKADFGPQPRHGLLGRASGGRCRRGNVADQSTLFGRGHF